MRAHLYPFVHFVDRNCCNIKAGAPFTDVFGHSLSHDQKPQFPGLTLLICLVEASDKRILQLYYTTAGSKYNPLGDIAWLLIPLTPDSRRSRCKHTEILPRKLCQRRRLSIRAWRSSSSPPAPPTAWATRFSATAFFCSPEGVSPI